MSVSIYPQYKDLIALLSLIEQMCNKDDLKSATYYALRLEDEAKKLFEYLYRVSK